MAEYHPRHGIQDPKMTMRFEDTGTSLILFQLLLVCDKNLTLTNGSDVQGYETRTNRERHTIAIHTVIFNQPRFYSIPEYDPVTKILGL